MASSFTEADTKCIKCTSDLIAPIKKCFSGRHNICYDCHETTKICPECRTDFLQRNKELEEYVKNAVFSCPYQNDGCTHKDKKLFLENHVQFCEYRPRPCVLKEVAQCNWMGFIDSRIKHLKEKHPEFIEKTHLVRGNVIYAKKIKLDDRINNGLTHFTEYDDSLFYHSYKLVNDILLQYKVNILENNVLSNGPAKPRYNFKMKFSNPENKNKVTVIEEFCEPLINEQNQLFCIGRPSFKNDFTEFETSFVLQKKKQ